MPKRVFGSKNDILGCFGPKKVDFGPFQQFLAIFGHFCDIFAKPTCILANVYSGLSEIIVKMLTLVTELRIPKESIWWCYGISTEKPGGRKGVPAGTRT